jgi:hypothetical protein
MTSSVQCFGADYSDARGKFLEACASAMGKVESIKHPLRGPSGEELYVDVAMFGNTGANKSLVLISGTHGVEGFCGSGAQVDLLRRGEVASLPRDVAVLMIHAINPYGFAWIRRTTHENIDLNRNWIDFSQPLPDNPDYSAMSEALVPHEWDSDSNCKADALIAEFALKNGADAFVRAVTRGQYHFPNGLHYGGKAPCWSRVTLSEIYRRYLSNATDVGIIDYHTGLGPWGFADKITTSRRDSAEFRRVAQWYGSGFMSEIDASSSAVSVTGDGLTAVSRLLPDKRITAIALEVGTIPFDAACVRRSSFTAG